MEDVIRVSPNFTLLVWTDDETAHIAQVETDLIVDAYPLSHALKLVREKLTPTQREAIALWGTPLMIQERYFKPCAFPLNKWVDPNGLTLIQEMGGWRAGYPDSLVERESPEEAVRAWETQKAVSLREEITSLRDRIKKLESLQERLQSLPL